MELTIFTPTYNRSILLTRVYESLLSQTNKNFVWLIVDDGSLDDTRNKVEGFIENNKSYGEPFAIEYYYYENGGKMRAHNRGVEHAGTEWFLCLDSDDYLRNDAVEIILNTLSKESNTENLGGIIAHKGKSETETLSPYEFPKVDYSTLFGLYLSGFKGETTLVLRKKLLDMYPFPQIKGEKYVPEDVIYDKIDKECVFKVLPEILTVCELVSEGYTDSVHRLKEDNKFAWFLYYEQRARITSVSVLKFKYLSFYVLYADLCKLPKYDSVKAVTKVYDEHFEKYDGGLSLDKLVSKKIPVAQVVLGCLGALILRILRKS